MRRLSTLASLLLLTTLAAPAHAVLITGVVQGVVESNFSDRPPFGLPVVDLRFFAPGEAFELTYSFDPARAILGGSTPTAADYTVPGIRFRITAADGYSFEGIGMDTRLSMASVGVMDGPNDRFSLSIGGATGFARLIFTDPTGMALSSTALPTLAEINRFSGVTVEFGRERATSFEGFRGSGVPVSTSPVPEPSSLALGLLGFGLAGVGWGRRRASGGR